MNDAKTSRKRIPWRFGAAIAIALQAVALGLTVISLLVTLPTIGWNDQLIRVIVILVLVLFVFGGSLIWLAGGKSAMSGIREDVANSTPIVLVLCTVVAVLVMPILFGIASRLLAVVWN